ncbi:MAG: ABC transporter ATP-binding protein [Stomatobaculum sp.]
MNSAAAEFRAVRFQYPAEAFSILDRLSFRVERGEFICIIGSSGCGKSTIFRLMNQLLVPAEGQILVGGEDISGRKHYCGYMPQQDLLFPWRTVAENVRLPLEIRGGRSRKEMDEMTAEALKHAGLEAWGSKAPRELSGGMRQRAAFARTLLTGSGLLLLDEPFSALDYLTRLSMREWLLRQWEREKKTVLFITHDVEEAVFLSTRILAAERSPITALRSIQGVPDGPGAAGGSAAAALKERLIALLRKEPHEEPYHEAAYHEA